MQSPCERSGVFRTTVQSVGQRDGGSRERREAPQKGSASFVGKQAENGKRKSARRGIKPIGLSRNRRRWREKRERLREWAKKT